MHFQSIFGYIWLIASSFSTMKPLFFWNILQSPSFLFDWRIFHANTSLILSSLFFISYFWFSWSFIPWCFSLIFDFWFLLPIWVVFLLIIPSIQNNLLILSNTDLKLIIDKFWKDLPLFFLKTAAPHESFALEDLPQKTLFPPKLVWMLCSASFACVDPPSFSLSSISSVENLPTTSWKTSLNWSS